MRRLLSVLLIATVLTAAGPAPASAATFRDVPSSHTFAADIAWLSSSGITTGYPDGTFRPSAPVLREQMAAFLYRLIHGGANPARTSASSGFRDVPTNHTFKAHIRWLSSSGVTAGYAGGTFRPGAAILREQMAAFLYRLAGSTSTTRSCGLADVPASHTFAKEICWAKNVGITRGYAGPNGTVTYRGSEPVLREQMAAFLHRFSQSQTSPLAGVTPAAWRILSDTNAYRVAQGRAPVVLAASVNVVAQSWTQQMASSCLVGHNPAYSSQIPGGWQSAAENVAAGQQYTTVVQAWIGSPGHRVNLLGNYSHLGVGYVDTNGSCPAGRHQLHRYFTQVFAKY